MIILFGSRFCNVEENGALCSCDLSEPICKLCDVGTKLEIKLEGKHEE